MPSFSLQPAAFYTPKMGKKALGLLATGLEPTAPESAHIESVRSAWKAAVTDHARSAIAKAIEPHLAETADELSMLYGARPTDAAEAVEFDSAADDMVVTNFDPSFAQIVGVGGWAEHTLDTRIDDPARRSELAQKLAGEIIANGQFLTLSDDEARKIIADNPPKEQSVGTTAALKLKATLDGGTRSIVGTAEHPQTGISYESAWATGLKLVRAALASGSHDVLSIGDELELCIDSDDILGTAGAQRLAPDSTPEIVRACMQVLAGRQTVGEDWTEALVMAALDDAPATGRVLTQHELSGNYDEGGTVGVDLAVTEAKAREVAARKTPAEQTADGAIAHEVMMRLLSLAGMPEQAMADILGCSRGMVNAAVKGRKNIDWTPDKVAKLKQASMEFATNVAIFHDEAGAL